MWYQDAKAWQIERNVKNALLWIDKNDSAGMVLMYAWNEYSEGGWLNPTTTSNYRLNRLAKNVFGGEQVYAPEYASLNEE